MSTQPTVVVRGWHIEKGIPLVLLSGIMLQLVIGTWMASKYDSRLTDHESRISANETTTALMKQQAALVNERLVRIETKLDMLVRVPDPALTPAPRPR